MQRQHGRAMRSAVAAAATAACLAVVTAGPGTAARAAAARSTAAQVTGARATAAPAAGGGISWSGAQRKADDLAGQLTLDEKISLVHGDTFGPPGFAGHVPG